MMDDISECLYDWVVLDRYTGFCQNEWAESRKHSYKISMLTYMRHAHSSTATYSSLTTMATEWRVEKSQMTHPTSSVLTSSGAGTRMVKMVRSFPSGGITQTPHGCPVWAAWWICHRAQRFGLPPQNPFVNTGITRQTQLSSSTHKKLRHIFAALLPPPLASRILPCSTECLAYTVFVLQHAMNWITWGLMSPSSSGNSIGNQ